MPKSSETSTLRFGHGKKINRCDLAYAAAFLDAEGTITGCDTPERVLMTIRVASSTKSVIDWFELRFGGGSTTNGVRKKGWKTVYCWSPASAEVKDFLELLIPFMKIKGQQARLALVFRSMVVRGSKRERRLRIIQKIQALNQR